jgi:hypothetical protein
MGGPAEFGPQFLCHFYFYFVALALLCISNAANAALVHLHLRATNKACSCV